MRRTRAASRRGFSMLETVIALAVLSLGAALVFTRAGKAVDQIAVHAAFQDFQTATAQLRREAFSSETPLELTTARAGLPTGWSFRAAAPVTIGADGDCAPARVDLLQAAQVRARLVSDGRGCRFLRES